MTRSITDSLLLFVLSLGSSLCLMAQSPSADTFLNSVSTHPAGDEAEQDQFWEMSNSLNAAPRTEVERVLPSVLVHVHSGAEAHARVYATGFLMGIAMRPDGAALLSSSSGEISALIADPNPTIQHYALAAMDYVIGKADTDSQAYLAALRTALQRAQTSQAAGVEMIRPLLTFGGNDPGASDEQASRPNRENQALTSRRRRLRMKLPRISKISSFGLVRSVFTFGLVMLLLFLNRAVAQEVNGAKQGETCKWGDFTHVTDRQIKKHLIHLEQMEPPCCDRNLHLDGVVSLRVAFDPTGSLACVEVLKGNPIAAAAALEAIKSSRFSPFSNGGKQFAATGQIEIQYSLRSTGSTSSLK